MKHRGYEPMAAAQQDWLRRAGFFWEVIGFPEAIELLSESRLHVSMLSVIEALGITSGPLWEVAGASLLNLNGEAHRQCRSVVAGRFTPRAVERIRPVMRKIAPELIAAIPASGSCEFVGAFATPYVRKGTCSFVGFDEDEVSGLWPAVDVLASARDHLDDDDRSVLVGLVDYARTVLAARIKNPRDDILTLVADEVVGGSLPELVGLGIVVTLFSAGHEPTIKQLAILIDVLSRRPDVWDAVSTGEVPPARIVEAILRYRSTNQGVARRVHDAFDYRGFRFEEGMAVLVNSGLANHDPRQFAAPDELDVEAKTPHLAFGFGAHHCLGASLARVQMQEAIGALASHLHCPEVVEVVESDGALIGPTSLTVKFAARNGHVDR